MMFWAKGKTVAAVLLAAAIVGGGVPMALRPATAGEAPETLTAAVAKDRAELVGTLKGVQATHTRHQSYAFTFSVKSVIKGTYEKPTVTVQLYQDFGARKLFSELGYKLEDGKYVPPEKDARERDVVLVIRKGVPSPYKTRHWGINARLLSWKLKTVAGGVPMALRPATTDKAKEALDPLTSDKARYKAVVALAHSGYCRESAEALTIIAIDSARNDALRECAAIGLIIIREAMPVEVRGTIRKKLCGALDAEKEKLQGGVIQALVAWGEADRVHRVFGEKLRDHPLEVRVLQKISSREVAVSRLWKIYQSALPPQSGNIALSRRWHAGAALILWRDKRGIDILIECMTDDPPPMADEFSPAARESEVALFRQSRHNTFMLIAWNLKQYFGYEGRRNWDPGLDKAIWKMVEWWKDNRETWSFRPATPLVVQTTQQDKPLTKRQARALAARLADDASAKRTFTHPSGQPTGKPKTNLLHKLKGHTEMVRSVVVSRDGRLCLSGGGDVKNSLKLWDPATGRCLRTLYEDWRKGGHQNFVQAVAFHPGGRHCVSVGCANNLKLWNLKTGRSVWTVRSAHVRMITSLAFSPDGRHCLSGSLEGTLKLWNAKSGRCARTMTARTPTKPAVRGNDHQILSVAFSPKGRRCLSGDSDNVIILWNVATGKRVRTMRGHEGHVQSVAFSPDGRLGLSGSQDKTLKLWDLATGRCLRTMRGHEDFVQAVAFSPDGQLGVSVSGDYSCDAPRLWNLATGKELGRLPVNDKRKCYYTSVAFGPKGRYIVAGGNYARGKPRPPGQPDEYEPCIFIWSII